ncbi:MAG: hypothetical protein J7498_08050 [Sphingobium sp.]|nr:hypothetical protein [Sphingobium sp.]
MNPSDAPATGARQRLLGVNGWLAIALLVPFIWATTARGDAFPLYLFQTQDMPVIGGLIALLLLTDRWSPRWTLPTARLSFGHVLAAGIAIALLLWLGCYALLGNYPLSRDEHMVVFDMGVFAHGHLAEPIAAQWRPFAVDLVPAFLLQEKMPVGLVSDYLPGNAALRLIFSYVADPALMNPLLVLCGGLALFDIARRLFGDDSRAIWVALLTYALSAQVAVNAMLPYAMTAHMALNLLWLAAFLRGRWWHVAAILTGLIATGLHQIVFHPLFVAPFLLWRLRDGHWRLVLAYGAAYAAICGWWITYPVLASMQAGAGTLGDAPHSFFADRVLPLLLDRDPMTLPLMTLNLLRFVAWQNLALLPLLAIAAPLALNTRSIVAPMFWGALGAILFFGFILPYQGHGWGYRYLHPYLGSFVLLAAFGYRRLASMKGQMADGMVVLLSAATLFGSMPHLVDRTRTFFVPHLALERFIARQQGDFVLVDTERMARTTDGAWAREVVDQVRNLPDLSNRPLRFSSRAMRQMQLAELCRRGTVTLITRADMRSIGFAPNAVPAPHFDAMIETTRRAYPRCFRKAD